MIKNSGNIFVIDDQIENFDIIEALLANENYQFYYASGGRKAFSLLEKIDPDLILLDVMMPEMNGLEVCQSLKSNSKYTHIPVIMVTALNTKDDLAHCLEQGADDFLSKPIDSLELRARIRSHLRIKQQHDELQELIKLQKEALTLIKQQHDELQELVKLREEALTLREDMSNMIVHDLRNPLSGMLLSAEIIKKYGDRPDKQALLIKKADQILISGKRLQNMIDSLLLMAKLEAGKILFNPVPTDLHELGAAIITDFELTANDQTIELQGELPNPGNSIIIDAVILRRVIENLISNALKFSPPNSQVWLQIEYLPENHFRVKVTDNGSGISLERAEDIFKKFEIGTFKANVSQIGLGLAFCKMAVEAQGGTLTITPNQPQGSIFTVEI